MFTGPGCACVDGGEWEGTRLGFCSSDGHGGGDRRGRLGEPGRSELMYSEEDMGGSREDSAG